MNEYKVIDLFAGAGGLSLGFVQTKKFKIMAAVEKNPHAQNTYEHFFKHVDMYDDILEVDFEELNKKYGNIDIVIGGPPCQGFSNANRQHNQAINLNNKLVKEYIRAIIQIRPKAFVMENVGMLKSDVHRFYIEKTDEKIVKKYSIPTSSDKIFLLDEKYKFNNILSLLSDYDEINRNLWPEDLFKELNIIYKNKDNTTKLSKAFNKYKPSILSKISEQLKLSNSHIRKISNRAFSKLKSGDCTPVAFVNCVEEPLAIQKMLKRACEIYNNSIREEFDDKGDVIAKVKSCAVYDYLTCILGSDDFGYAINNGILAAVDYGIPQKRRRFVIIGVKKEFSQKVEMPTPNKRTVMTTVYDAIADLKSVPVYYSVEDDIANNGNIIHQNELRKIDKLKSLRNKSGKIYNHVVPLTRETALARFKAIRPGENFHALSQEMKENTYTNIERTQNTVYLRLDYSEPSGTVINVRKSMWIHPELDRAISIREAARLQTFPDNFRFYGPKDSEYQQVGNAVPPMLANIIAKQILKYIEN